MSTTLLCDRYLVRWSGDLPLDAIGQTYEAACVPELGGEEREALARMLARRERAGRPLIRLENGELPSLYRMLGFGLEQGRLQLELGRTDYAEYLLTNVEHPEWREEKGDRVMSDALAVCAVLVTEDGRVPWGRRSRRIIESRSSFHLLPSGHPEPPRSVVEGLFDELEEETGVRPEEIREVRCTGLVSSTRTGKSELTFLMSTSVAYAEIFERERAGAWEFEECYPLPWNASSARSWLVEHRDDAVPPGHAAILLGGRLAFGEAWFQGILRALGWPL
jgi:8-oxo-dGTP pyrophosphatase MutT (NUDIX family)